MNVDTDRAGFYVLWGVTMEQYGRPVSDRVLEAQFLELMHYSLEDIQRAVKAHRLDPNKGMFPPQSSNIVAQLEPTDTDEALRWWPEVQKAIQGGLESHMIFKDTTVHQVVQEMGGLYRLGMTNLSEMPFLERKFIERFTSLKRTGNPATYPEALPLQANGGALSDRSKVRYIGFDSDAPALTHHRDPSRLRLQDHSGSSEELEWMREAEGLVSE